MPSTPILWHDIGQVNQVDTGPGGSGQQASAVVQLAGGRILVVWQSDTDSGAGASGGTDIIGRIYTPDGEPWGGGNEIKLATKYAGSDHELPQIVALDNGGFSVAYELDEGPNHRSTIVEVFKDSGALFATKKIGWDTSDATPSYCAPQMAHANDTHTLVAFIQDNGGGDQDVRFKIRDMTTTADGGPATVTVFNGGPGDGQGIDSIATAALANGNFVVAYSDIDSPTDSDIALRIYNQSGTAVSGVIDVVADGVRSDDVQVTALTGGRFVVTWVQNGTDIVTRIYNPDGTAFSGQLAVPTTNAGLQQDPAVGALSTGGFVVAWIDNNSQDVRGMRFDSLGNKISGEFTIYDGAIGGSPSDPVVTGLADGRFTVSWTNHGILGDTDVAMRIFDPRDLPNPSTAGHDLIVGTIGDDTISGGNGKDSIYGGDGNDMLRGDAGGDHLYGGDGIDTAVYIQSDAGVTVTMHMKSMGDKGHAEGDYWNSIENVIGSTFDDELHGHSGQNGLDGAEGNDKLFGFGGDDVLLGGSGNDTLDGEIGADSMAGGVGNDLYKVDNVADVVLEGTGQGADTVESGVSYTLSANVETLVLTGTANIDATGNLGFNTLVGNDGNNVLDGKMWDDVMIGGDGNDTFVVRDAGDIVIEDNFDGHDLVQSFVSWTLEENVEDLTLKGVAAIDGTGNEEHNVIIGNNADNRIDGQGGQDTMKGGDGNDHYVVDDYGDAITEALDMGIDTVETGLNYMLGNNVENLTLNGFDDVYGYGNKLANVLTGNAGDNDLKGMAGADTLTGGSGTDWFYFNTALGAGEIDTITDFNAADDSIFLDNAVFDAYATTGAMPASAFKNIAVGSIDANDRILYDGATGALFYDADGSGAGAAVQFAMLVGAPTLTAADFLIN